MAPLHSRIYLGVLSETVATVLDYRFLQHIRVKLKNQGEESRHMKGREII
jgi:hypothetical protein